jgi:alkyl sulfatase BDS1-like metallo-beta-lactamase superfamily hydrolase
LHPKLHCPGEGCASLGMDVTGDADALPSILAVLDPADPNFNIVTP